MSQAALDSLVHITLYYSGLLDNFTNIYPILT